MKNRLILLEKNSGKQLGRDGKIRMCSKYQCSCGNIIFLRNGVKQKSCGCGRIKNSQPEDCCLTLIERNVGKKDEPIKSRYICKCGKIIITRETSVRNGHTKSCGCILVTTQIPKDSRLTLIEDKVSKNKRGENEGKYLCDCGNVLIAASSLVRTGNIKSCGCLTQEHKLQWGKEQSIHGLSNTRIYRIWKGIKGRCLNKKLSAYKYYGERGIKMCKNWENSFESFYNWAIKNGYNETLTIDRVDVNGNYKPSNCRWISKKENLRNRRKNLTINEVKKIKDLLTKGLTVNQISKLLDIKYYKIYWIKRGWTYSDGLYSN